MPAVTAVIAGIVLPYLLATIPGVLPTGAEEWLVRITPAAAFSIQQSLPAYPQVTAQYTPGNGYFPLAPWAVGLGARAAWGGGAGVAGGVVGGGAGRGALRARGNGMLDSGREIVC